MQLLPLQKYAAKDYNGLVTKNHLATLYQMKPELISTMIKQIYRTYLPGEMISFLNQFPVKEVFEDEFFEWMLQGQHDKNLPLVDCYDAAGNAPGAGTFTEPGRYNSRFFMVFTEKYFEETNVILGEREPYHLYVVGVKPKGSLFEYEVELIDDPNGNLFVPVEELASGTRWSKDYDLVSSTLSSRGAKPNFTSPWRMRNTISQLRMQYEVPGNMIGIGNNRPLEFSFMNPMTGKPERTWINYQDLVADAQFEQMKARMSLYGRKNWANNDVIGNKDPYSKFDVKSGSGLFEQIDPTNIHYYTQFDIDWMCSVLLDMGVGRIERGRRMITLGTGEFGALQFHQAVQNNTTKWTPNFYQERIFKTSDGGLGAHNPLGYGGQFLEYHSVNGVGIKLQIIPFFDDKVRFKKYHPSGAGLTESYRYIALDYGGESGIHRLKVKGKNPVFGYIPGMRDPFSPDGGPKLMASSIDGYEFHRMDWCGMHVEDPTKIVDFRYNLV